MELNSIVFWQLTSTIHQQSAWLHSKVYARTIGFVWRSEHKRLLTSRLTHLPVDCAITTLGKAKNTWIPKRKKRNIFSLFLCNNTKTRMFQLPVHVLLLSLSIHVHDRPWMFVVSTTLSDIHIIVCCGIPAGSFMWVQRDVISIKQIICLIHQALRHCINADYL